MVTPGHHRVPDREELLEAEEVPRRLRRVRRLVEVGLFQQRRPDQRGEDRDQRHEAEHGHELADQQVGPGVDLVLGLGPGLLDGAGLDDGEEPLGVTPGAGGGRGRRGGGGGRGPATGGGWRLGASAGGRGGRRRRPWRPAGRRSGPAGGPGSSIRRRRSGGPRARRLRPRPAPRRAGASAGASAAGASSAGAAPPSSPGTGRPSALRRSLLLCSRCSGTSPGMSRPLPT